MSFLSACLVLILSLNASTLALAEPSAQSKSSVPSPIPSGPSETSAETPTKNQKKANDPAYAPVVPGSPTAPSEMGSSYKDPAYACDRYYLYQGKRYLCDSHAKLDGEKLREILKQVPEAEDQLNLYQKTRRDVRLAGYIETAGVALALLGLLAYTKDSFFEGGQIKRRGYVILSGLTIAGGTFLYSLSLVRANEKRLDRAVEIYNQARPKDPLTIELGTQFNF